MICGMDDVFSGNCGTQSGIATETEQDRMIGEEDVRKLFPKRAPDAHKGDFGHVLVVAGKQGMMGASILAAGAALKSGCGLVTVHVPAAERLSIHITHPSAMVSADHEDCFSVLPADMSRYTAAGVGPGLGRSEQTAAALIRLLETGLPLVLDADALNIISSRPDCFGMIPGGSVLTPHAGELRRLLSSAIRSGVISGFRECAGTVWADEEQKKQMASALAAATGAVVVVKGHNTAVCTPDGRRMLNTTGNPGMAKGGSGDVLTGFIAGLLARGFAAGDAAMAGVWLHGRAGDCAAAESGEESMNASDILSCLKISFS